MFQGRHAKVESQLNDDVDAAFEAGTVVHRETSQSQEDVAVSGSIR